MPEGGSRERRRVCDSANGFGRLPPIRSGLPATGILISLGFGGFVRTKLVFLLCALALYLCAPAGAQTLGEITGEVRDAQGAVIPGAEVIATNIATNVARNTMSNDAGVYAFPALPPGAYTVRVSKTGF